MNKYFGFILMSTFLTNLAWAEIALPTPFPEGAPPPWQTKVDHKQFNPIYTQQWRQAQNRHTCARLVLPRNASSHLSKATGRRASFHGGWAVAYDKPNKRSVYGVAGAGTLAERGGITRWSRFHVWPDGSAIGWGLEGDTGPNYLAYVQVKGQKCLYNVWSSISEEHLLSLIRDLRMVK